MNNQEGPKIIAALLGYDDNDKRTIVAVYNDPECGAKRVVEGDPNFLPIAREIALFDHPLRQWLAQQQGRIAVTHTIDTVYNALLATFEEVREPGKSALVIPLDEYARTLSIGTSTLRKAILRLHDAGRIHTRKMDYPVHIPEAWQITFTEQAEHRDTVASIEKWDNLVRPTTYELEGF